ncbi:MAG: hypothetical protein IMW99_08760 [Firmicutes bacterium]|nr:hypothetical protein [Bacillota bacterium]
MALSFTETWWLEECVKAENLAIKKLMMYKEMAQDSQAKAVCNDLEQNHRRHLDMLINGTRGL